MNQIDGNQLLKLAKKHKKWNEDVTVEIFPYLLEYNRYFLAYYHGKFSLNNVKAIGIISPDSLRREHALEALERLIYFTVTFGKIENSTKTRAELEFDIFEEIRNYLKSIMLSGVLYANLKEVYERSFQIINKIIALQDEMLKLRETVNNFARRVLDRGYFVEAEIEEALELFPIPGWIQFKQLEDRYRYRHDFDIIYENRNNSELVAFNKFKDPKTLYNMTSKMAERSLKESLDIVTDSKDMSSFSKVEYCNYWITKFKKSLSDRYEELRNRIRFP